MTKNNKYAPYIDTAMKGSTSEAKTVKKIMSRMIKDEIKLIKSTEDRKLCQRCQELGLNQ